MSQEQPIFVAMRVADFPRSVPGATTEVCAKCGAPVWVTPASRPLLERAAWVECNRCQPPRDLPLDQVELPTPGQLVEVEAHTGPPGQVVCRVCRRSVEDSLFIKRAHLAIHSATAMELTAPGVHRGFMQ